MTFAPRAPAPPTAARETLPPPVGAGETVRGVHRLLDRCGDAGTTTGYAASALIGDVDRAIARLEALRLSLVAAVDRDEVATESGMSGTPAWLAARTRSDSSRAAREVRLATALHRDLPATRDALASGVLSSEHAQVIATTAARLPEGLQPAERQAIETALVDRAKLVDPTTLRKTARRALAAAHRTQAEVEAHEDAILRSEEEAALAKTRLTLHDNRDGTLTGHFTVPTLAGHILRKVIQQIASPRRIAAQAAHTTHTQATSADRDWAHRYGTAFVELLEHLPTDHLSGKVAATVVATIDHDRLRTGLGAAHLDTGHDLSASDTRRLACNAGILPAILDGTSLPLDLGRTQRFFTEHHRVALATRYDTCAADGCDRPYAWSELHHQDPWSTGGHTNLHSAVPVCGHHHRRIHDPGFDHHITTDQHGIKTVSYRRRT